MRKYLPTIKYPLISTRLMPGSPGLWPCLRRFSRTNRQVRTIVTPFRVAFCLIATQYARCQSIGFEDYVDVSWLPAHSYPNTSPRSFRYNQLKRGALCPFRQKKLASYLISDWFTHACIYDYPLCTCYCHVDFFDSLMHT